MNLDMTTLTDTAATKVWEELNGGSAAPLDEQDDMVKFSVRSKVLPVVLSVIPAVEAAVKDNLVDIINESHEAGHDAEFTLMAITAYLSDDE